MSTITPSYSLMQGAEWAIDGCLYCYSSVFLLSCGLNNTLIGVLLGIAAGLSFWGQIFFGELLNRRGRRALRGFLLLGAGVLLADNLILLAGIPRGGAVPLFLINCLLLQLFPAFLNSAAMCEIQLGVPVNFGVGRGTGSLGYALCSVIVGRLLLRFGTSAMFCVGAALSAALLVGILWFFASADAYRAQRPGFLPPPLPPEGKTPVRRGFDVSFLRTYRRYTLLLGGCVLLMMGHTYMSNFIYQIVAFKGGNEEATGVASAIAACAEVPVLFLFGRVIGKLRCDQWLKLSCVLLTAKMLLAYFSGNLFLLQSTELLQLGYALFVVSSVYYTGAVIPHRDAISGQAYLNAASTLGVLLSLLTGGILLDCFGVPALLLTGAGALAAGTVILFCSAEPAPPQTC